MPFCENCGTKLNEGVHFCAACGHGEVNSKTISDQKWYEKNISNWTAVAVGIILVIFLLLITSTPDTNPSPTINRGF
jgi:uncharacterized membrane protein YvbJ